MSNPPAILRLPQEIRLQITQNVLRTGPDPSGSASSTFCCLEEWLHDYIRHRYAILEVPGFRLKHRFPHAMKQEVVVVAWRVESQWCTWRKRCWTPDGRRFWCFGLRQRFLALATTMQSLQWYHVDAINATKDDTVHFITDVNDTYGLRRLLSLFLDQLRPQRFKLNLTIMARDITGELNRSLLYHFFGKRFGRRDVDYPRSLEGACTMLQDLFDGEQIEGAWVEMTGLDQVDFEVIDVRHEVATAIRGRFEREKSSGKFLQHAPVQKVDKVQIDVPIEGPIESNDSAAARPRRLSVDQELCKVHGEATWQSPPSVWEEVAPVALSIVSVVIFAVLVHFLLMRPLVVPMALGCFGSMQHYVQHRVLPVTPTTVSWVQPTKPVLSPSPSTNRRGRADAEDTDYMMVYSQGMMQLYAIDKKSRERPQTPRQEETDFARTDPSRWSSDNSESWSPPSVDSPRTLVVAREVQEGENVCPVQTDVCKVNKDLYRGEAERASGASWII